MKTKPIIVKGQEVTIPTEPAFPKEAISFLRAELSKLPGTLSIVASIENGCIRIPRDVAEDVLDSGDSMKLFHRALKNAFTKYNAKVKEESDADSALQIRLQNFDQEAEKDPL